MNTQPWKQIKGSLEMNLTDVIKKRFFFVRHGQTKWNTLNRCQGTTDIELNEAGRLEAMALGKCLQGMPFSLICTSPLKRAFETAKILQDYLPNSTLRSIDELKERGWGPLEGASSQEMYLIEEMEEKNRSFPLEKGIEPRESFRSRIIKGINIALKEDDTPIIVSHGRVFLVLCELLNIPLIRQIPNTTLIECLPETNRWQIRQASL